MENPQGGGLKDGTMNRTSLWIVVAVTSAWLGFLVGYAVSSHTEAKQIAGAPEAKEQAPAAGGYGR